MNLNRTKFSRMWILAGIIPLAVILPACTGSILGTAGPALEEMEHIPTIEEPISDNPTAAVVPTSAVQIEQALPAELNFGYTYHRPDGNRLVAGVGELPEVKPLDIPLTGAPQWLAATADGDGSVWAVVLEDGAVQAFSLSEGGVQEIHITPQRLPAGTPPFLKVQDRTAEIISVPDENASFLSHPVVLDEQGESIGFIAANGDVIIQNKGVQTARLKVNALPDARLLVDENGRILLLSDPTRRYDHGVLGDDLEAASITMIETKPEPRLVLRILVDEPAVIEGIAPIWTDLNADGEREIIVTRSDAGQGAQLVVYDQTGREIAAGPAIGQGYRWRNQLGAAPISGGESWDLVDVLTPHLTGVVEFYRLDGENLDIEAQISGYTSHVIGTRNLDMGLLGDFDGDQKIEALLPNQARTEMAAVNWTGAGAELAWSLPVNGVVSSNLAAVTLPDGKIVLGVGREDGNLRIWAP